MTTSGFDLSVDHRRTAVRVRGELDVTSADTLRDAVDPLLSERPSSLSLDCSGVTFLAAAGISVLVDTAARCKEQGTKLDLVLSPICRSLLDRIGLWWLGVVDDGISISLELARALRAYAEQVAEGDESIAV